MRLIKLELNVIHVKWCPITYNKQIFNLKKLTLHRNQK
ncbi:hypothetical protein BATR1942_07455 [Bacillus atrophaeus 1942]|uniref:Uncharacterized protein n=1 Tax=Bacillus atrophaeus (strain 1942) TaxID=720555 RepID=A0ABM5LX33_BACA1|nr:hypothetical protein BATR1942_07455 [Bacillus atrophaeus 1942]EIM11762.1 hypothetical protein UY9_05902 [Bacillus atrophaeus C89]